MTLRRPGTAALRLIPLPFVVLAVACNDSPTGNEPDDPNLTPGVHVLAAAGTDVTLFADADVFEPGEPVTLTLENGLDESIGFNLCFNGVEEQTDEGWDLLPMAQVCTTHMNIMQPGGTATHQATLDEDLEAGTYRFRVSIWLIDSEDQVDQVSGAFEIGD